MSTCYEWGEDVIYPNDAFDIIADIQKQMNGGLEDPIQPVRAIVSEKDTIEIKWPTEEQWLELAPNFQHKLGVTNRPLPSVQRESHVAYVEHNYIIWKNQMWAGKFPIGEPTENFPDWLGFELMRAWRRP